MITSMNFPDAVSNLMKMKDKSFKMAYNAQFATAEQIITAYDLNNEPTDVSSLIAMIKKTEKNTGKKVKTVKADAGYFSSANIEFCVDNQIDAYIHDEMKSTKERQERKNEIPKYDRRNFQYNSSQDEFICPAGKSLKFKRLKGGENRLYIGKDCASCSGQRQCTKSQNRNLIMNFQSEEILKTMRAKLNTENGRSEERRVG